MRWLVFTALGLAVSMQLAPAFAASSAFRDVSSSTPYARAIGTLKNENVIEGYADGTFKPDATINRAELLKIILEAKKEDIAGASQCFPDVQEQWFAPYVCTAKEQGIVAGYDDGLFRPEKPVTFAEAAKIFSVAYKQDPQAGVEWYEGFVRALESSKAIPPTMNGLTKQITRAEMAEMMWRLSENVTDQPSIGYLNVKYPDMTVNLSADTVQTAASCTDLQAFMREAGSRSGGGWGVGGGPAELMRNEAVPTAAPMTDSAAKAGNDGDYARTNVQTEGVDEGDIVKTDGTYLYIVSGGAVRIVKAVPADGMRKMSEIFDEDSTFSPQDLYIDGDRLVVIGNAWAAQGTPRIMNGKMMPSVYPYYPSVQRTQARIYDVSDRAKPTLERKVSFDGSSVSTRMIGHKLYLVVNQPMRWYDGAQPLTQATEDTVLPQFSDSKVGDAAQPVTRCGNVMILPHVPSPQYLTVGVIDVSKPTGDVARTTVLGNAQNVYASLQNLFVAAPEWTYHWDRTGGGEEKTNVYRFRFTDGGVTLQSQGSVPGHILNQFSMDEHENTFRIATTKGRSWNNGNSPSTNNLYIMNMSLENVGKIEEIAPGETIYAVRFLGDRAYMVTFRTIDPLFVIDTSDPRNPAILGKLKIPGFSDYLHPYDENHIIGFGKEAVESKDGTFAWQQGMKMAIFDVTDVANPKEMFQTGIGDRGTDSPLLQNHKALLFDKQRGLLSFPVTVYEIPADQKTPGNDSAYGSPVFQGAYVYRISLLSGFTLRGRITHYTDEEYVKAGDYWYGTGKDIQRVTRIGESLYTVSDGVVQANALSDLKEQGSVTYPVAENPSPCGRGVPCIME